MLADVKQRLNDDYICPDRLSSAAKKVIAICTYFGICVISDQMCLHTGSLSIIKTFLFVYYQIQLPRFFAFRGA